MGPSAGNCCIQSQNLRACTSLPGETTTSVSFPSSPNNRSTLGRALTKHDQTRNNQKATRRPPCMLTWIFKRSPFNVRFPQLMAHGLQTGKGADLSFSPSCKDGMLALLLGLQLRRPRRCQAKPPKGVGLGLGLAGQSPRSHFKDGSRTE